MLRKVLICAVMMLALTLTGCGEEKVAGSPDKAVLAYVETVMTGESENLSAAGFGEKYAHDIRFAAVKTFTETLKSIVPLSDATAQELGKVYFDRLKGAMTFKATVKTAGDRPIVELTTTPIDYAATAKTAVNNDELMALLGMVGQLKAEGATEEQLKDNADVQALAVKAFGKYVADISFQPEKSFEVPCQKLTGEDGKTHWAPAEGKALIDFLTGQN